MDEEILKIAICEDTKDEEEKLLSILDEVDIPNYHTVFHSAEDLLKTYQPQAYDLLLMDIYMGGMTGVEAVTKIREVDEDTPVAFITTSKDHALESYRLQALKYIEKPYQKKAVSDILQLAKMEKENAPCLVVHWNGMEEHIRFSQIIYLEAQKRQLVIYLRNGDRVQVYDKLSSVLPQLSAPCFFSPHKSYCVHLDQVRGIDKELKCFQMSNGSYVPIRRETMGKAKKAWEAYLFDRTRGMSE